MNKVNYFLFLSIFFFMASCQKDDFSPKKPTDEKAKKGMEVWNFPAEIVFENEKELKNEIIQTRDRFSKSTGKDAENYDFSIDEEEVQVIFTEHYTQFTFLVERDDQKPGQLENYIYRDFKDGRKQQYLTKYYYTLDSEDSLVFDPQNTAVQLIEDSSLEVSSTERMPQGCLPEFVDSYEQYTCISVPCSGDDHEVGDSDCNCGALADCEPASTQCGWQTVFVYTCNSSISSNPSNPDPDPYDPTFGGGTNYTEDEDGNFLVTFPLFKDLNHEKECNKITEFLENNPDFKSKMQDLSSDSNLALNYEKAAGMYENENTILEWQGDPSNLNEGAYAEVTYDTLKKFTVLFHTHPDIGDGTSSIFSLNDLIAYATFFRKNHVTDEFIVFLATDKGTHYAMSFTKPQRLVDLLYHLTFDDPFRNPNSGVNFPKYYDSEENFVNKYDKYFNPEEEDRLIDDDSTDDQEQLTQFIKFLKRNGNPVKIFETDENFERITEAKRNFFGTLVKKPCNPFQLN
jgi:hypothetical protein